MKTITREYIKTCPYCGQSKIPFKMGICICGKQVGNIQYVNNTESFAANYYTFPDENQGYDTAIAETFAGLEEI